MGTQRNDPRQLNVVQNVFVEGPLDAGNTASAGTARVRFGEGCRVDFRGSGRSGGWRRGGNETQDSVGAKALPWSRHDFRLGAGYRDCFSDSEALSIHSETDAAR